MSTFTNRKGRFGLMSTFPLDAELWVAINTDSTLETRPVSCRITLLSSITTAFRKEISFSCFWFLASMRNIRSPKLLSSLVSLNWEKFGIQFVLSNFDYCIFHIMFHPNSDDVSYYNMFRLGIFFCLISTYETNKITWKNC